MQYKILEQNGIDNENVDGAAFNNFCAGGRSGIIKEVFDECAVLAASENTIYVSKGELLVHGVRIKISELWSHTISSVPAAPTRYQLIADLTLTSEKKVEFDILCRVAQDGLTQEALYKTESGHYQVEIARFTHTANGIEDIVRTLDIITGGASGEGAGAVINIGDVTTQTLAAGLEAEVDVENRYDEEQKKWVTDFQFAIPKGDKGEDGKDGKDGSNGKDGVGITNVYTVDVEPGAGKFEGYTRTNINVVTDKGNSVEVYAKNGEKGDKGDVGNSIFAYNGELSKGSSAQFATQSNNPLIINPDNKDIQEGDLFISTNGAVYRCDLVRGLDINLRFFADWQGAAGVIPTIDSALSSSSTNPVQNKVIDAALREKVDFTLSTCGTSATATAKTVTKTGFTLSTGARITIKFTYANTVNSPTLNVNSTGAKPIKADGDTTYVKWLAGSVMEFIYDGTNWVVLNGYQLAGMRQGALYFSNNSTSPATLFGGSWTQITDRFIVGAGSSYSVGATGGEAAHTLTINEMPAHDHEPVGWGCDRNKISFESTSAGNSGWKVNVSWLNGNLGNTGLLPVTEGNGEAHNNMPPYRAEYIWYRTA